MSTLLCAAALLAQDFQWPVSGSYTQGFAGTFSGIDPGTYYDANNAQQYFAGLGATGTKMHRAIDLGCATGTAVKAARGGTAYRYGSTAHFYGYYIIVHHDGGYTTLYAHLSSFVAANGAAVAAGQTIAYSGATGNVSGPHLHFEIRHTTNSVNYAPMAHYIPGTNIGAGNNIPFDYPGIGPSAGPPPAPTGLSRTVQSSSQVAFAWNTSPGADGYWVDLTTDPNWSWFWNSHTTATSFTWGGLSPGTTYHWRVYAYNSYGGAHGYGASFTTPSGALGTPAGLTPANWQTVTTASVPLDWTDVGGAAAYEVAMLYWNGASWIPYYTWTPGASTLTLWPSHGLYYAWHVRARNGAAAGPWSDWAYFHYP